MVDPPCINCIGIGVVKVSTMLMAFYLDFLLIKSSLALPEHLLPKQGLLL